MKVILATERIVTVTPLHNFLLCNANKSTEGKTGNLVRKS